MALHYKINFSATVLMEMSAAIDKKVLPLLHQAVQAVAAATAADWKERVLKADKLWSVEKDKYAESITWEMTGDFTAMVQADYKYAQEIETGRPPRDLKRILDTSQKVRRTKDGRRFLVIPMRHNTPGNTAHGTPMPTSVAKLAKALTASSVVKQTERPSGEVTNLSPTTGMHAAAGQTPYLSVSATRKAAMVTKNHYGWGDRLTKAVMKAAGVDDAAMRKRYAGLVKMQTTTPGGKKSNSYMTFRIMMEGSKGWVVPATPGKFLAAAVVQSMQPKATEAFQEAIKRTLKG